MKMVLHQFLYFIKSNHPSDHDSEYSPHSKVDVGPQYLPKEETHILNVKRKEAKKCMNPYETTKHHSHRKKQSNANNTRGSKKKKHKKTYERTLFKTCQQTRPGGTRIKVYGGTKQNNNDDDNLYESMGHNSHRKQQSSCARRTAKEMSNTKIT